jgi:hypothetical protein
MKILDCETVDSIYESLEQILGLTSSRLNTVLESFDVTDNRHAPEDLVFAEVEKLTGPTGNIDRTCWFHLTRTHAANRFTAGILPLGRSIDSIWMFLETLAAPWVSSSSWEEFRRDMGSCHSANLYRMKVNDQSHWGPYAMLIRDHAFNAQVNGNHDYLSAPEIVEDICICFRKRYKLNLLTTFMEHTRPCIVKMIDEQPRKDCVAAAVYHLYNLLHGFDCSTHCSTCYDGEGIAVTPDRILTVEFPAYGKV